MVNLRPFFFFFFFFFFPAEFSPSSPSVRVEIQPLHQLSIITSTCLMCQHCFSKKASVRDSHLPRRPPLSLCLLSPASPAVWSLRTLHQPPPQRLQHGEARQQQQEHIHTVVQYATSRSQKVLYQRKQQDIEGGRTRDKNIVLILASSFTEDLLNIMILCKYYIIIYNINDS